MSLQMRTGARIEQDTRDERVALKKPAIQMNGEQANQFDLGEFRSIPRTKQGKMTPQDVLHLQRTLGNQAVMRMLAQRRSVRREDDDDQNSAQEQKGEGGPDITLEDEQKILRAKHVVQRAWTGRRQLGHGNLNKVLGKPWVWSKSGNWLNLGLYHEHIFFEDAGNPPNIGHMGKQGLGQDRGREGEYAKEYTDLDDAKMRKAVDANASMGDPGKYTLLSNNCQKFVASVLKTYHQL